MRNRCKIFFMRPLTPRERAQARREWRAFLRWFLKHFRKFDFPRAGSLTVQCLALLKFLTLLGIFRQRLAHQLLKRLILAKFCNGLIGNSVTDFTAASAYSFQRSGSPCLALNL
jgi:hypothetical protein